MGRFVFALFRRQLHCLWHWKSCRMLTSRIDNLTVVIGCTCGKVFWKHRHVKLFDLEWDQVVCHFNEKG